MGTGPSAKKFGSRSKIKKYKRKAWLCNRAKDRDQIQDEIEKKARSPKSRCSCPEMKNDQDQMTEERGAVPKTSYAGGKFDPKKNVRGGDRKIRGTDADRKAISRAEMKSRAEKERDDATPSTSKAAWKELEAEKGAKPATQSDLSAAKSIL